MYLYPCFREPAIRPDMVGTLMNVPKQSVSTGQPLTRKHRALELPPIHLPNLEEPDLIGADTSTDTNRYQPDVVVEDLLEACSSS